MDQKKERRHHPFFRLMLQNRLAQFAAFLLVILVFLCFFVYITGRNSARLRLEHQRDQLAQRVQEIDHALEALDYRQRELLTSDDFRQFLSMYDDLDWYKRFDLQERLYRQVISLRSDGEYVKNAWLHIPSLEKTISDYRVSMVMPEWLADCTEDGRMRLLSDGSVAYTTLLMDYDSPESPVSSLTVLIDEDAILRQLSWLLRGEKDEISLHWSLGSETPFEETSGRDEKGRYSTLCVASERFPLFVHYVRYDDEVDSFVAQIVLYCVIFVLLVLLVQVLSLFSWYRRIYKPLHHLLIDAFDHASQGDYKYRISIDKDSAFYPIYDSYNHMMEKTDAYVENNLKQQILVNRANLKQLQSQISPHFMYNSYYVLYRLIKKGDQESSLKLAEHLGQFYHYVTRNADDEKRLSEEVNHARNYAAIQKFRFRDALDIEIDDPQPEIAGVYVPRLILQPLLENAFKHAYETEYGSGVMKLVVHFDVQSPYIFDIFVENSGSVTDDTLAAIREKLDSRDDTIETTALVNIHRRLKIYYGESSALGVERSELGGLKVRMHIEDTREEF